MSFGAGALRRSELAASGLPISSAPTRLPADGTDAVTVPLPYGRTPLCPVRTLAPGSLPPGSRKLGVQVPLFLGVGHVAADASHGLGNQGIGGWEERPARGGEEATALGEAGRGNRLWVIGLSGAGVSVACFRCMLGIRYTNYDIIHSHTNCPTMARLELLVPGRLGTQAAEPDFSQGVSASETVFAWCSCRSCDDRRSHNGCWGTILRYVAGRLERPRHRCLL